MREAEEVGDDGGRLGVLVRGRDDVGEESESEDDVVRLVLGEESGVDRGEGVLREGDIGVLALNRRESDVGVLQVDTEKRKRQSSVELEG